jgi:carboxyl-terminal processing protease
MKKIKIYFIIAVTIVTSGLTLNFSDGYFEVSKNLEVFSNLYRELNIYYVDETNPGMLMKSGIDAMLKTLDPYTNFIPESDIEDYRFMTTGQYGGIGSLIMTRDSFVVISEPYENSPAAKAGIIAGDIILEVDGLQAKGKKTSELSKMLKGEPGTELEVVVKRPGQENTITSKIIREKIKIDDVPYYGMVGKSTGYIKLTSFTQTASKEVKAAFDDLKLNNAMQSVILDLRGNGGGLLREAVNIVNIFVEKGQEVVYTRGKVKQWDMSHKTLNEPTDLDMPVVVLIDGGSASASEIVSGTLQDLDRAIIIGDNSYGKGLVQQTKDLGYNSKLKVTVAKYYTPSGRCIQRLDYANKDAKGRAIEVADSLIAEFKTKNGRPVFDGAGITPDINVEFEPAAKITISLLRKHLLFDYATQYKMDHDTLLSPEEFHLSDEEYQEFLAFIADKDYDYTTRSESLITKLEEVSNEEKYYDDIKEEFAALEVKIAEQKKDDVKDYKDEILRMLENEIVSRYYYQNGRIRASLAADEDIAKALEVFDDSESFTSILSGAGNNN